MAKAAMVENDGITACKTQSMIAMERSRIAAASI